MVSKNENKLMKFIQAQTVCTTVMLGSFGKSWGTFFTNIILKILCPEHFYVVYFLQNHYRKVSNRRRASIKFFEFRSALLFKNFKILCSKISLKSLFCALLFKPRLYLNHSYIWNFTVVVFTGLGMSITSSILKIFVSAGFQASTYTVKFQI